MLFRRIVERGQNLNGYEARVMNGRQFLRAATASSAVAAEKPRPNILWISCEDSSPHAFSCYGEPLAWTPNIDAVARRGVRYSHQFTRSANQMRSAVRSRHRAASVETLELRVRDARSFWMLE